MAIYRGMHRAKGQIREIFRACGQKHSGARNETRAQSGMASRRLGDVTTAENDGAGVHTRNRDVKDVSTEVAVAIYQYTSQRHGTPQGC